MCDYQKLLSDAWNLITSVEDVGEENSPLAEAHTQLVIAQTFRRSPEEIIVAMENLRKEKENHHG